MPEKGKEAVKAAVKNITHPVFLVDVDGQIGVSDGGKITIGENMPPGSQGYPLVAYAPPLHPENFGDPLFKKTHNLRYAYVAGAMANGITSVEMVEEMGRAGMIGFFGAGGLSPQRVEEAIDQLQQRMGKLPFGFNLLNSPHAPELEEAVVYLYLKKGVKLVSAAAYMKLTLPLVYFRVKGIHRDNSGNIVVPNKVIAKVSRVEVARKFFSPPPKKLLAQLVEKKKITGEEAKLAESIPMAEDVTAEADSGGHTDNRPAFALLSTMIALRDEMTEKHNYQTPLRVGLGGGIATPESAAAAFAMGAAYVLTGTVNQACIESGTSDAVRQMLSKAGQADVTMAPSADMFQMGVKVQVLKRGTMYPIRAAKLYELYTRYDSLEDIPEKNKDMLENKFFHSTFEAIWEKTAEFFAVRDPKQITKAEKDPKHKMALVFRSYLGQSSRWAIAGDPERLVDSQIWCGPAIGAFNEWVKGSFLEKSENRKVATVAMNLLFGASVSTRLNWLRTQGVSLAAGTGNFSPMKLTEISKILDAG
jgi:trans-AT polyketide synthase/acyltransferase/oxidoreductase domain-containing protein